MLKKYLISPPFGNWISHPACTRVKGSYTLKPRHGLLIQTIKTLRPHCGGWINNIGLRNPGIQSVKHDPNSLISIAAINESDWFVMKKHIPKNTMIEMNFGCPNIKTNHISHMFYTTTIGTYVDEFDIVSVKLPPTKTGIRLGLMAMESGAKYIHMGNSLPIDRGGYSGPDNLPLVASLVEKLANAISKYNFKNTKIIAGGGIRSANDIGIYSRAGATHFSLSTAWFSYWKTRDMLNSII